MAVKSDTEMMTLRMPKTLYRKIEGVAEVEKRTLTSVVLQAVTEFVGDTCPKCGGRVEPG